MSKTSPAETGPAGGAPYTGVEQSAATAWVGWVLFGALMMVMLGSVHAGAGLAALARPGALAGGRADLLLPVSLDALARFHIVLGVVAMVVGVGLLRGHGWARLCTVFLACVAALANFAFVWVYPVWSITALAMASVIVYAVAVHGAEVAGAYGDA